MIAGGTMTVDTAAESTTQPADPLETPLTPVGTSGPTPASLRGSAWWWIRAAAITITVLGAYEILVIFGGFVSAVLTVVLYLVFGAIISFIVGPIVDGLARWLRIPRTLAILMTLLGLIFVVGVLLYLAASPTVTEAQQLSDRVPDFINRASNELKSIQNQLSNRGINVNSIDFGSYAQNASNNLSSLLISGVTGTVNALIDVIVILVVAFWLLKDGEKLRAGLLNILPANARVNAEFALDSVGVVIGGYVRAQLLLAVIIGTMAGVGCAIIGVPFPIVVALAAGLFELIPVIGPFVGGAVAVLLALTVSPSLALVTVLFFIGIHLVEGYVLSPRIQAKFVQLHPLVSLLALFAGIEVRGFLGAFFAVPIASLIAVYTRAFIGDVRAHRPELYATQQTDLRAEIRREAILGEFRFFKRSPLAVIRGWLGRGSESETKPPPSEPRSDP
jgi:predicted PurR-regulated permease PerM